MAIGNDGNWVNADRPLDDANYMSIAEWCAWTTRVAAELLGDRPPAKAGGFCNS